MNILIFAASHRPLSLNRQLAIIAARHAESLGATIDYAEYQDFDMPIYNDEISNQSGVPAIACSFGARVEKADGIIICTPEYNWSYPGSLKNILDWTSRLSPNPLAGKTALLASATPGSRGGVIGLQQLRTPLEALQMFVFPKIFPLGKAHDAFDGKKLAITKQQQLFFSLIEDYIAFTRKLKK